MKDIVTELLKLQASAQSACDLARKAGDQELFYELRRIGWASADCLAKVARTQTTIVVPPEALS